MNTGHLYKYYSANRKRVLGYVLHDQLIRFTQRTVLNDLYELSPSIRFPEKKYRHARELIARTHSKITDCPPTSSTEFEADIRRLLNDCLILSLSSKWDIMPMWSHYSNNFKGFVVGFDQSNPFFSVAEKVQYVTKFPVLSDDFKAVLTKHKQWGYELEWRIIKVLGDAEPDATKGKGGDIYLYKFPPSALTEVILGPKMTADDERRIRTILSTPELSHVALFSAEPGRNDWSFERRRIR